SIFRLEQRAKGRGALLADAKHRKTLTGTLQSFAKIMGTGASSRKNSPKKSTYEEANIKLMSEVNKKIEKELAESLILNKKTIKLLLIGGAESGKSTIAKQIK
uniref:Uncharacterized protein n=1 Tax=Romanomermis culicivorax TaxID=13658 RepID=A0A915HIE7_ROMCU